MRLVRELGVAKSARQLGCGIRAVYERRERLERKYGQPIIVPDSRATERIDPHPERIELSLENGVVLIGSDHHYHPGEPSTAHKAFVHFCKKLNPKIVVANGDVLDFGSISRHPPIGWEKLPSVIEEIEVAKDRLGEITKAAPKARRLWPLGNHDARFETRLAMVAPEYAKVHGLHLKDHFDWEPCYSIWINDEVVIKHRFKGGIHAVHNNTLWSGKTIITGHLHSLKVTPFTDYNGTRWGVDTGTMADPYGPQFIYLEDNPRSWRTGFIVLTFVNGRCLWPEVVSVVSTVVSGDVVDFRGALIKV